MKVSPILLGLSLAACGNLMAAAQDSTSAVPQVLQITREYIKAGKNGMAHDRTEGVFVAAMARAKWPTHYIALNSLSGKSRALYLTSYASFDAWEKDTAAQAKNAALSAELDRANFADGELLDSVDQAVCTYNAELSYHPKADLSQARFMEVSVYHVRPGHDREFHEAVKMVIAGYQKAGTGAHWATFDMNYGRPGGDYLVLSSKHGMSEIDTGFAEGKKFGEAMGEDGMKKLDELVAASIESSNHELFSVNPRQSYVDESWIKADPDFWKPKSAAPKADAAAAKPAANAAPKPASR
jgi:hypothetical protein